MSHTKNWVVEFAVWTYPDITWKLFVVPVCWKSCIIAAIIVANISKSVSQLCGGDESERRKQRKKKR